MGLQFETAAQAEVNGENKSDTFMLDRDTPNELEVTYTEPGTGQVALVMALTEERQDNQRKTSGIIEFFFSVIDEDSRKVLQARLWDANDAFDFDMVQEIVQSLLAEWSGRPTKRSLGSTPQPATSGTTSSDTIPGQISSSSETTPS